MRETRRGIDSQRTWHRAIDPKFPGDTRSTLDLERVPLFLGLL